MKKKFNKIMDEAMSLTNMMDIYNASTNYYKNTYKYSDVIKKRREEEQKRKEEAERLEKERREAEEKRAEEEKLERERIAAEEKKRAEDEKEKFLKSPLDTETSQRILTNVINIMNKYNKNLQSEKDRFYKKNKIIDFSKFDKKELGVFLGILMGITNIFTAYEDSILNSSKEEAYLQIDKRNAEIEEYFKTNRFEYKYPNVYKYFKDFGMTDSNFKGYTTSIGVKDFEKFINIEQIYNQINSAMLNKRIFIKDNDNKRLQAVNTYFKNIKSFFDKYYDSLDNAIKQYILDGEKNPRDIIDVLNKRNDDINELNMKLSTASDHSFEMLAINNLLLEPDIDVLPYLTYKELVEEYFNDINNELTGQEKRLIFGSLLESIQNILESETSAINSANGHANAAAKNAIKANADVKKGLQTPAQAHQKEMEAKRQQADAIRISQRQKIKDQLSGEPIKEDATAQLKKNVEIAQQQLQNIQNQQSTVNANIEQRKEVSDKRFENRKAQLGKRIETLKNAIERSEAMAGSSTTNESMNTKMPETDNSEIVATSTTNDKKVNGIAAEKISSKDEQQLDEAYSQDVYMLRKDFEHMIYNGVSGKMLKNIIENLQPTERFDKLVLKAMQSKELDSCIKNIKYLLGRHRDYLRYDEYIKLKVEKQNFKVIYDKAKKEIDAKFKK